MNIIMNNSRENSAPVKPMLLISIHCESSLLHT